MTKRPKSQQRKGKRMSGENDRANKWLRQKVHEKLGLLAYLVDDVFEDAKAREKQRATGRSSPGRRGKFKVPPETLEAAVLELQRKYPALTWDDACGRVARNWTEVRGPGAKKVSVGTVRTHTRHIKWPDPRRRHR